MRYIPRLRSPVSGSRVTTQGSVMNRPPSNGQHFNMGRFNSVGALPPGDDALVALCNFLMSGASGHGSVRVAGASNLWMTSLQGPDLTDFGLAWRKSSAVPSSLMAS